MSLRFYETKNHLFRHWKQNSIAPTYWAKKSIRKNAFLSHTKTYKVNGKAKSITRTNDRAQAISPQGDSIWSGIWVVMAIVAVHFLLWAYKIKMCCRDLGESKVFDRYSSVRVGAGVITSRSVSVGGSKIVMLCLDGWFLKAEQS